jgi:hypothetical protein
MYINQWGAGFTWDTLYMASLLERHTKRLLRRLRVAIETTAWKQRSTKLKKLRGFGPRANYADRATAAFWQS